MMKKLGQSAVLGELIGGILLGPTLLGKLYPGFCAFLFPASSNTTGNLDAMLKLAMLFFMFAAGLEIKLAQIREYKRLIVSTSILGGVLPFALGFALVTLAPALWGEHNASSRLAWFIGILFAISALPVIARILIDLGLVDSQTGLTILSSAMLNDIAGWAVFSCLLKSSGQENGYIGLLMPLILYAAFLLTLGRWLIGNLLRFLARQDWPGGLLTFIGVLIFLTAASADAFGVHNIFAVFLLGMIVRQVQDNLPDSGVVNHAVRIFQDFSLNFFAPLYFVSVGLKVNLNSDFDALLTLAVILLASCGKILGAGIGARLGGMTWRNAWPVGVGLNARGAVGLVFASVALENHLIDARIFGALVVMALVTTLMSGILLKRLLVTRRNA